MSRYTQKLRISLKVQRDSVCVKTKSGPYWHKQGVSDEIARTQKVC